MPIIKIKGIGVKQALNISKDLIDELELILKCPRDYFNLSLETPIHIKDREIVDGYPLIEVLWFERSQEIQDKVAQSITKHVNLVGYENVDVIFHELKKENYYENGEHF